MVDCDTLCGLMLELPKGLELAAGQMFISVQMVRNWDGIPGGSVWPVAATTCCLKFLVYFLSFMFGKVIMEACYSGAKNVKV